MKTLTPLFVVKAHYFRQSNTNTIIEEKFGLENGKYLSKGRETKTKKNQKRLMQLYQYFQEKNFR